MKKNLQNRVHETSVSEVLSITGTVKELANAPHRLVALLMFARTASTRITDIRFYMNQSHTFTKAYI